MCEFHGSNGNGFGDIWWTDNPIYFSSIDSRYIVILKFLDGHHGSNHSPAVEVNAHNCLPSEHLNTKAMIMIGLMKFSFLVQYVLSLCMT